MALLGKDEILTADDYTTQDIAVPEWGGEVRIRTLSGTQRDEFEAGSLKRNKSGQSEQDLDNFRARFCAACIVDENGQQIFVSKQDIRALGGKSVKGLQRVFNAATKLNAMTEEDVADLEADFDADADGASTSA